MRQFGGANGRPNPLWRETARLWSRSAAHRRRVESALRIVEQAAAIGPVAVSSSWGKDSTCCVDLALRMIGPSLRVFHLATSYRLPGWEPVARHFSDRCQVVEIPSPRALDETIAWLHEVGLGCDRTDKQKASRKKASGGEAWCKESGIAAEIMGLRREESRQRDILVKWKGRVYQRSTGLWVALPIADWTSADVWSYLISRDLPWHRLYDCETHGRTRFDLRNTGWLTTIDASDGRIAWLERHYPEQYRALVAEWPHLKTMT